MKTTLSLTLCALAVAVAADSTPMLKGATGKDTEAMKTTGKANQEWIGWGRGWGLGLGWGLGGCGGWGLGGCGVGRIGGCGGWGWGGC
uniref:Secreted protein n=1 Tax=Achlya hypogyna TaxID=1202772 RepID=A0A0A7CNT4_ACHHY|nr:secreted protein [Achlya hypogyna]